MRVSVEDLKSDGQGLVPVIVQDARTLEVLTLAYVNEESLRRTINERETWFWSRSRQCLWHKGESSGNTQRVVEVAADCDLDALRVLVEPNGPACHTGARSCFHHQLETRDGDAAERAWSDARSNTGGVLAQLYSLLESRRRERPAASYTTYLFNQGLDKILKKLGEESAETIIAAKNEETGPLVAEISDLVYHLLVLMVERGVKLEDVAAELAARGQERRGEG